MKWNLGWKTLLGTALLTINPVADALGFPLGPVGELLTAGGYALGGLGLRAAIAKSNGK